MGGGIGNVVEAAPLIQALRVIWPKSHLTFATSHVNLFEDWCVINRLISEPDQVAGEVFDHAFLAYLYEDKNVWADFCQVGTWHAPRIWKHSWFLKNEREYYVDMARRCGFKGLCPPGYVNIREPLSKPNDAALRIGVAACGSNEVMWRHKRWPYYSELINRLISEHPGIQICIIGSSQDELPDLPKNSNALDLRGAYTLSETAWLLRHCDLVIGNDCGPMHIADAVQTNGFVIFGPTCVIKNGPRNKIVPLIEADCGCSPCQYTAKIKTCEDAICMRNLKSDEVYRKIEALLKSM